MVRAVISNPISSSVRSSTCRPSGTDGIDGFDIGIALTSGHHANQRPNHLAAPKVRMTPKRDPCREVGPFTVAQAVADQKPSRAQPV